MQSDTVKLLAGPFLALIPIFVWELIVKPRRLRRAAARMLLSELQVNLDELAYYAECRSDDKLSLLVNLALPRATFAATHAQLGELPDGCMVSLIRFYAVTAKLEATHAGLEAVAKQLNDATDESRTATLDAALDQGLVVLDRYIQRAWELGVQARIAVHKTLIDDWSDPPSALVPEQRIQEAARRRHGEHLPG